MFVNIQAKPSINRKAHHRREVNSYYRILQNRKSIFLHIRYFNLCTHAETATTKTRTRSLASKRWKDPSIDDREFLWNTPPGWRASTLPWANIHSYFKQVPRVMTECVSANCWANPWSFPRELSQIIASCAGGSAPRFFLLFSTRDDKITSCLYPAGGIDDQSVNARGLFEYRRVSCIDSEKPPVFRCAGSEMFRQRHSKNVPMYCIRC